MEILKEKEKDVNNLFAQIYVMFELMNYGKVLDKSFRKENRKPILDRHGLLVG
ncbi:hypothetical protein JXH92_003668 [Salmonella enterica subsp. enterica serovar 4,[5],12:b:-]|nr:hypothetical protein [Salmonella enterica subsp. enterica serovar 4,[5],12:b:-]